MRYVVFVLGTPCVSLMFPCFWYLPSQIFKGARAAAITTLGSLGGFLSQNLSGMAFPAEMWALTLGPRPRRIRSAGGPRRKGR